MKTKLIFILFLTVVLAKAQISPSQVELTPNGLIDKIYDRFGQQYSLYDLNIHVNRSMGGGTTSAIGSTFSAGYFVIHFDAGSLGDLNTAARDVICQVFSDISSFITSAPLIASGVKINIQCSD